MVVRWVVSAFPATEKNFRRIMGHQQLWMLKSYDDVDEKEVKREQRKVGCTGRLCVEHVESNAVSAEETSHFAPDRVRTMRALLVFEPEPERLFRDEFRLETFVDPGERDEDMGASNAARPSAG